MPPAYPFDPATAEQLRPARGAVEFDWPTGELTGWLLVADTALTSVQLYVNGVLRGTADLEYLEDLANALPRIPHAGRAAFSAQVLPGQLNSSETNWLVAVGFQGGTPVARLRVLLTPDHLAPDIPVPSVELIEKTQGNHDRRSYQVLGYRYYRQFLETVARYRAPSTIHRILDFGCGCGRIAANFLADPAGFQVDGCDLDPEAIEFCRSHLPSGTFQVVETLLLPYADASFDLVFSLAVFPAFGPNEQAAVLEELRRVTAPGGLVLVTLQGPLTATFAYPPGTVPDPLREGIFDQERFQALAAEIDKGPYQGVFQTPDYTRRLWSGYFDVLDHQEGAINGDQDLVVLQRPVFAPTNLPGAGEAVSPVEDLYPPDEMNFIGGEGFREVGNLFAHYFIEHGGLQPHHRVLDVGCGIGRLAIPLTQYLTAEGSYEGFDIVKMGIDWCASRITPRYPNFRFQLADLYNKSYLPEGTYFDSEYAFPYEDESFDFVYLTSVFTHLLPEGMENYLYEIARVLKKGGRCLITWFLMNPESRSLAESGRSLFRFQHRFEKHSIENLQVPEAAVGFEEPFVLSLYERFGMRVHYPIRYGNWCQREKYFDGGQDVVIATKVRSLPWSVVVSRRLARSLVSCSRLLSRREVDYSIPGVGAEAHIQDYLQSMKKE